MNETELEQVKGFEDLISAIFRQAVKDEVNSLTRRYVSDISVKHFIESGQFQFYARMLIALDHEELLTKFWQNVANQTVRYIKKRDMDITISFLIEDERKAFEKYL